MATTTQDQDPENKDPEDKDGKKPDEADAGEDGGEQEPAPEEGKKPPLSELLKDPKYAREHGQSLARERKRWEEDAKKRWDAEAADRAKKATMGELDRLKAEKAEVDGKLSAAESRLRAATIERDVARGLAEGNHRLHEGAMEILLERVLAATRDEAEPDIAAATEAVLAKHPYLVKAAEERKPEAKESKDDKKPDEVKRKVEPTGAGLKKTTQRPAEPEVKKPVDVWKMTPQEFAQHRRTQGIA